MNCNWLCPWELFFLFVCVCAWETEGEGERSCLLSFAKSGFNPALSFSSPLMFWNAQHYVFSGWDQKNAAFRKYLAPEISERSPFSLAERQGRQQQWWQSSVLKTWREWHCHTCQPSAMLKNCVSRALPDPARAVRGVTACAFSAVCSPFPCPSPCLVHWMLWRGGLHFTSSLQPVRRRLVISPGSGRKWMDMNHFPTKFWTKLLFEVPSSLGCPMNPCFWFTGIKMGRRSSRERGIINGSSTLTSHIWCSPKNRGFYHALEKLFQYDCSHWNNFFCIPRWNIS